MICVVKEKQREYTNKNVSLPDVDFGFSVLNVIGSRAALETDKITLSKNSQNMAGSTSTMIISSLLRLVRDGLSSLKLNTQQYYATQKLPSER